MSQMSPYLYPQALRGNLSFGDAQGVGGLFSGNLGGLASSYQSSYNNALQLNQQNYANILSGYQSLQQQQAQGNAAIQQGYGNLSGQVLGDIQGIGASQKQAIQDVYAQQSGSAAQDLINRGLGNSTVTSSVQRGLGLDEQKAQVALANQMAQLTAGYRSNLGMAGLNFANQANQQNTALGAQQLGFQNSVQAGYPSAQAYGNVAGQIMAAQQAQAGLAAQQAQMAQQNALAQRLAGPQMQAGGTGGVGGRVSYSGQSGGMDSGYGYNPVLGYQGISYGGVPGGGGGGGMSFGGGGVPGAPMVSAGVGDALAGLYGGYGAQGSPAVDYGVGAGLAGIADLYGGVAGLGAGLGNFFGGDYGD